MPLINRFLISEHVVKFLQLEENGESTIRLLSTHFVQLDKYVLVVWQGGRGQVMIRAK